MSGTVRIDRVCLEGYASTIQKLSQNFERYPLELCDDKSTITANTAGQTAYYRAREGEKKLCDAIRAEAENMRNIGWEFEIYDALLATMPIGR